VAETTVPIGWAHLALALLLVGAAIALSAWQRLGLSRSLVIGATRAVIQLTSVGYVLLWLFSASRWYFVVGAMLVMTLAATFAAIGRQSAGVRGRWRLRWIFFLAILLGAGFTLTYVVAVVIDLTPWYDPRYLIPLFGMIVGNAMNGAAQAAERLQSEMSAGRAEIEAYLALGATPEQASATPARRAMVAAMIPAINSLAVVGLVSLPGMMTGQILAGSSPTLAVHYQLVVVFMLTAATALTAAAVVLSYRKTFFTPAAQLLPGTSA